MYKIKTSSGLLILLAVLIFEFAGCSQKEATETIAVMPSSFEKYDFSLSDIATDILLIPLSSDTVMGPIRELKFFNQNYYIHSSKNKKLFIANKDGRILQVLNKSGRGPEEYIGINDFHVDTKGNIIIHTATEKKFISYNKSLEFLQSIPYPEGIGRGEVYWLGQTPYIFPLPFETNTMYDWLALTDDGQIADFKLNAFYNNTIMMFGAGSIKVIKGKNSLYRYREMDDTIFSISKDGYKPIFIYNRVFKDGLRMPTREELSRKYESIGEMTASMSLEGKRQIYNIINIGSKWIIKYRGEKNEIILFDPELNRSFLISEGNTLMKIHNDWIGTGSIWLRGVVEIDNHKYIISYMDAFKFLSYVNSKDFRESTPLKPEIKKQYQDIALKLSEDDNPVLILLRLK